MEVRELGPGPSNVLESFICLKAFMEWSVLRSGGSLGALLRDSEEPDRLAGSGS